MTRHKNPEKRSLASMLAVAGGLALAAPALQACSCGARCCAAAEGEAAGSCCAASGDTHEGGCCAANETVSADGCCAAVADHADGCCAASEGCCAAY